MILTKELVIATDQCTDYQFKAPFFPGESCEDIYNKNPESHNCSGYYWTLKRVFCGMTYTGSSCHYIYNKYPEIYKNNPKEKSGYYRLNNNQWTYCNMTEIAAKDDEFIYNCAAVEVIKSTYQSFLPGQSCESIYNNNAESREWSGYYWITSDRVYCGMNYTGLSCEHIYNNNPETDDKSEYYRINESQWTYCNMTAIAANGDITINDDFITTCAGVGGRWRRIVNTSVQEIIVQVSGGNPHNLMLASVEWPVMTITCVPLLVSLLMEEGTRGCVGELEDTRKAILQHFMGHGHPLLEQLMRPMFLDYQSLTVVIHVNTFGLLLAVVVKDIIMTTLIVPVPLMEGLILLLMSTVIITVSQAQHIKASMTRIILMTHCGTEQDV